MWLFFSKKDFILVFGKKKATKNLELARKKLPKNYNWQPNCRFLVAVGNQKPTVGELARNTVGKKTVGFWLPLATKNLQFANWQPTVGFWLPLATKNLQLTRKKLPKTYNWQPNCRFLVAVGNQKPTVG